MDGQGGRTEGLGSRLAFGLDRLEIAVDGEILRLFALDRDDPRHWQLHALELDAGHLAALAWRTLAAPPH